jgi:hypothetical protein
VVRRTGNRDGGFLQPQRVVVGMEAAAPESKPFCDTDSSESEPLDDTGARSDVAALHVFQHMQHRRQQERQRFLARK